MRRGSWILGWVLVCLAPAALAETFVSPDFSSELVTTLEEFKPVGVTWSAGGDMYIWQRDGVVRVYADGQLLPTPFVDLSSQVNTYLDRGMLGMALHPNFEQNGYVYFSYVHETGGNTGDSGPRLSRLVRVTADPSNHRVALPGSEVVLIGNVPAAAGIHTVGALRFGPDWRLFFGNGDASFPSDLGAVNALSVDSYSGKILRLNDDGTAPGDNPFDDGTNSVRSKVWAYGLRNPFRFALHPVTGEPFIGDVGWDTWEEVDNGPAGSNFGWPCYEGEAAQDFYAAATPEVCALYPPASVTAPVFTYSHADLPPVPGAIVAGDSITAGSFYSGGVYPSTYAGNFFFTDYVAGWIARMVVDDAGNVTDVQPFATGLNGPVALEEGLDGLLYYVSFVTGEVRRIRYLGPTAVASASPTYGYSPLAVTFSSAESSDAQGGALSYLWDFGDGATSTAPNPVHTYVSAAVQTYGVQLTVTGSSSASATDHAAVTINSTPPTAQVTSPPNGSSVLPGQVVTFRGSAVDPDDGSVLPGRLQWTVVLHHDTHIHTVFHTTGSGGSFVAAYHGTGSYFYETQLRAFDTSGLSGFASASVGLLPDVTAPSAPGSLSAVPVGAGRIDLAWAPATDLGGVSGYRVERCLGPSCVNFAQIATPTSPDFADGGLAPLTTYRYRVRAVDTTGNAGPYSNVAEATAPAGPVLAGLAAAYNFDDGTGTIARDATGRGHDGSILSATWSTSGKFGGALSFDGTNDLVTVPPSSELDFTSGATLEAWVHPAQALNGWATIIHHGVDDYFLHASNDSAAMHPAYGISASGGVFWISAPASIPVGAWTHLAATYDGTSLRLYMNGVQVGNGTASGGIAATSNAVRIGGNVPYGEYFSGLIDEVRLYDRPLTPAEIVVDRDAPVTAASVGPPAVPSGTSGGGMRVSKNDPQGNFLSLSWDDSCPGAVTHHIVFGGKSQLPAVPGGILGVSGVVCTASPTFVWSAPPTTIDPSRLVWWIVTAADANATEGSWGVDGTGQERVGPGPGGSSGACGTTGKSLSNTCGQ